MSSLLRCCRGFRIGVVPSSQQVRFNLVATTPGVLYQSKDVVGYCFVLSQSLVLTPGSLSLRSLLSFVTQMGASYGSTI